MTLPAEHELVVIDSVEQCPYLPDQSARMPLRAVLQNMTPQLTDAYFAAGYRRSAEFVYRTQCPNCQACEAIRLAPATFELGKSSKRTLARGRHRYREVAGPIMASDEKVALFNLHRRERGLVGGEEEIDIDDFEWGFVRSCFRSFELAWYCDERLVALSVIDCGARSWSAVYTFYDPRLKGDSLGTFAILRQLELCRERGIDWLYLGYYVQACAHMNYKDRFRPHQRLIAGKWKDFPTTDG